MAAYKVCAECGAHLDSGEPCECGGHGKTLADKLKKPERRNTRDITRATAPPEDVEAIFKAIASGQIIRGCDFG